MQRRAHLSLGLGMKLEEAKLWSRPSASLVCTTSQDNLTRVSSLDSRHVMGCPYDAYIDQEPPTCEPYRGNSANRGTRQVPLRLQQVSIPSCSCEQCWRNHKHRKHQVLVSQALHSTMLPRESMASWKAQILFSQNPRDLRCTVGRYNGNTALSCSLHERHRFSFGYVIRGWPCLCCMGKPVQLNGGLTADGTGMLGSCL